MDNKETLRGHVRRCQLRSLSVVSVDISENKIKTEVSKAEENGSSLTCDLCGFEANNKEEFNLHLKVCVSLCYSMHVLLL